MKVAEVKAAESRGGGDVVRRVVFRKEREEERHMIQSISFQDLVSVSF